MALPTIAESSSTDADGDLSVILQDEYGIPQPKPQQILFFDQNSSGQKILKLNKETLEKIIPIDSLKPIALLLIAGTKNQGKSFFLNYILRRLVHLEVEMNFVAENVDWVDINLGNSFTYGATPDDRTLGWWMWPRPFTFQNAEGQLYDLFLVDSPGLFGSELSQLEWSKIVGFSLQISSTIIFNLSHDIDEHQLETFADFVTFGLMAKNVASSQERHKYNLTGFQNLFFLVRDWGHPGHFPYGVNGGQQLVDEMFQMTDKLSEIKRKVRIQIQESFNSIKCSLLPYPGSQVLESNSHSHGFPPKLTTKFKQILKETIEVLMTPEEIPIFKVDKNPVTVAAFYEIITTYINIFNNGDIPKPETQFHGNIILCNKSVVEKCCDLYKNQMTTITNVRPLFESHLRDLERKCRQRAIDLFEHSTKFGDGNDSEMSKQHLIQLIDGQFLVIQLKNRVEQKYHLEQVHKEVIQHFKSKINPYITNAEFMDDATFQSLTIQKEVEATNLFLSKIHFVDCDEMDQELNRLRDNLLEQKVASKLKYSLKCMEKKLKVKTWQLEKISFVSLAIANYNEKIVAETIDRHVTCSDLNRIHERIKSDILNPHKVLSKNVELLKSTRCEINLKLDKEFKAIQFRVTLTRIKLENEGEKLVAEALLLFESNMEAALESGDQNFKECLNSCRNISENYFNEQVSQHLIWQSKKLYTQLLKDLKIQIENKQIQMIVKTKKRKGMLIKWAVLGGALVSGIGLTISGFFDAQH